MGRGERRWLLAAIAAMTAALVLTALVGRRWAEARSRLDAGSDAPLAGVAPSETAWSTIQDRLAACRSRLPAAGSPASRHAQQALLDLLQRHGLDITEVMPHANAELAKVALPACPGWPAVVMEVRGRATFPAVTAILGELPTLATAVLPLEVELIRGGAGATHNAASDGETPGQPSAIDDRRIQVRLVLGL